MGEIWEVRKVSLEKCKVLHEEKQLSQTSLLISGDPDFGNLSLGNYCGARGNVSEVLQPLLLVVRESKDSLKPSVVTPLLQSFLTVVSLFFPELGSRHSFTHCTYACEISGSHWPVFDHVMVFHLLESPTSYASYM